MEKLRSTMSRVEMFSGNGKMEKLNLEVPERKKKIRKIRKGRKLWQSTREKI